jgi:hypothetical protein
MHKSRLVADAYTMGAEVGIPATRDGVQACASTSASLANNALSEPDAERQP